MLVANPITYDGRVLRHAETLAQAGHEVTVVGVIGPGDRADPPPSRGFAWQRIDRRRRGVAPRLRWFGSALRQRMARLLCRQLSTASLASPIGALSVATSAPELLIRAVKLRPDVVHANDLNTLPAAAWAARLCRCAYAYDAHELYPDEHPDLSAMERRTRAAVEQRYVQDAAAVFTVNDLLAAELAARCSIQPPVVLRNLPGRVDVPAPSHRLLGEPGTLRLLYHGAHVGLTQHGVGDLLAAMAWLRGRVAVTLTLRGGLSSEEERALRQRLFELHLTDFTRLAPPVPGAEALVQAAVADGAEVGLAVHPPLCGSYVYTTSSKLYEYQAAGLAVCASDVLGNRHTVGLGAGVFYPAGDIEGLAAQLLELAMDRVRLRTMQQAAYAHAQATLCWERERPRLLAAYDELARRERG